MCGCQVVFGALLGLLILFFCFGGTGAASLEVERVFCEFTVVGAGAVVSAWAVPSLRVRPLLPLVLSVIATSLGTALSRSVSHACAIVHARSPTVSRSRSRARSWKRRQLYDSPDLRRTSISQCPHFQTKSLLAGILQAQSLAVSQGCLVFVVRLRLRRRGPVQRLVYLGWNCVSFSFGFLSWLQEHECED